MKGSQAGTTRRKQGHICHRHQLSLTELSEHNLAAVVLQSQPSFHHRKHASGPDELNAEWMLRNLKKNFLFIPFKQAGTLDLQLQCCLL